MHQSTPWSASLLSPLSSSGAVAGTQSLARALGLLQLIAQHHSQGIRLSELVQHSGLDRATAYRLLQALMHNGMVQRDAPGRAYRLGMQVMAMGWASMDHAPLLEHCTPLMKALNRRAQEPVFLVVRLGDYSNCLHLEQSAQPVPVFEDHVGVTRLLGLGIPSVAMLARWDDAAIQAHYQRHAAIYQNNHLPVSKLWRWVHQARSLGYAQIAAQGISGVGVHFRVGECADAALGIVSHHPKMSRVRAQALAHMIQSELNQRFQMAPSLAAASPPTLP